MWLVTGRLPSASWYWCCRYSRAHSRPYFVLLVGKAREAQLRQEREKLARKKEEQERKERKRLERERKELEQKKARELEQKKARELEQKKARELEQKKARELEQKKARELEQKKARELEQKKARELEQKKARELEQKKARELEQKKARQLEQKKARELEQKKARQHETPQQKWAADTSMAPHRPETMPQEHRHLPGHHQPGAMPGRAKELGGFASTAPGAPPPVSPQQLPAGGIRYPLPPFLSLSLSRQTLVGSWHHPLPHTERACEVLPRLQPLRGDLEASSGDPWRRERPRLGLGWE